ncbi:MAG: hypothetical protein J1F42_01140 [Lachnospiraceae bacterium]|nr:hypothetical protein [Lachnospiraceae bacterium]
MNRIVYKSQAIRTTVWIIVLCVVISLWPLRLVRETIVSDSSRQMVMESEAVTADYVVQQMFIAQYDRLKNIDIYFTRGEIGETFNFVLYDARMNIIMQQIIDTKGMKDMPGFCTVQVNIDVEVGREYYYLVQGVDAPFYVAYENTQDSGNIYNGTLYYENVEDTEHCMIAAYEYEVPLRKGKTLLFDVILLLTAVLVTYLTGRYYGRRPEKNILVTVEQTVKTVCNPLIVIAAVAAFVSVWPCKLFTSDAVSIMFYELSIVLAAVILLYAVNHNRTSLATDRTVLDILAENWRNYLQSVFFAGALWACCNYMNGLYDVHHTVAYRQMLIFFALSVIVTYKGKDFFNIVNLIYIVAASVIAFRYYSSVVAALENPDKWAIRTVKLTVWAGILAGFVIIGAIRFLVQGRIRDISVWYTLLVAVFFALIIWYRNTRGWPIYLVCAFGLFYLNMAAWDRKALLLRNICNGILFHFGMMVIYCLLHRPYMFFIYSRYPFIFHTVTVSGVYLALVVSAALVKFLDAYRRRPTFAYVYKELIILGVSSVYLLLTLSRTGYLAMLAMAVVTIPVMCFSLRRRWYCMLQSTGMIILAAMLCFPITFTAQRIVPSVAARPILHEIEELPVEIMHGRYMDSRYYMTIQRFIQVFQIKILGIPEEESLKAVFIRSDAGEDAFQNTMLAKTEDILLASAEDVTVDVSVDENLEYSEEEDSYANGRMEIFRLYYNNLNKVGHDDMGIMEPNGNYNVHAHNIYLQVAYDHGIYVGIVFILLGIGTLVQSAVYYHKRKADRVCAALPLAILVMFAVAGLTEWIFHPCNPTTFCLLTAMAPLLFDRHRTA